MSNLQIEERISLSAPPTRVWKFILDPARVAACLPGAKLDGTEGDKTFLGTMKVKVGPVLMEFKGKATMSEVVPDERRVTLTGTGNDKSGGGSAKMDMKCQVLAKDGGSEMLVHADVDLAGKLVRFGRGMMEGISKQLFKQFSERVRAELEGGKDEEEAEERAEEPPEEPPKVAPAEAQAAEQQAPEPAGGVEAVAVDKPSPEATKAEGEAGPTATATATDTETATETATATEAAAEQAAPPPAAEQPPSPAPAAPQEAPARATRKKAALAPAENAPLDAGSLVWAALWAWIKGLFARLFGKKS